MLPRAGTITLSAPTASSSPESAAATPVSWHSLRLRLPLLISVLIGVVVIALLWVAYREVESVLRQSGGARTQVAANQLASLLAQSAQQRLTERARAARDPLVRPAL